MSNFDDLMMCFENDIKENAIYDVADWLRDFLLDNDVDISDIEIMNYLRSQCIQEEEENMIESDSMKRKHRNNELHQKKAKRIWEMNSNRFYHPFGYYPVDKNGDFTDDPDQIAYYKRYNTTQYSKFLKRQSNKKIRKMITEDALRGSDYKKLYDYWWELY